MSFRQKSMHERIADWRAQNVSELPVGPMTKKLAKARVLEIEAILVRRPKPGTNERARLVEEKADLIHGLAINKYPDVVERQESAKSRGEEFAERMAGKPYTGRRCDFCGGPAPEGDCQNVSEDWPHPPKRTS